ncbi:hypothetical protein AC623_10745 [Bacillus sp. FJAT-27231]|uniref:hypothetical protein n=1 Tax=Bacillus sp. FJAT-27231 TaxID=1679168 RepID=UPI000670A59C|nr:hypothetical protein [Bacillus sp. FJAT-27231]KMY54347.1 hypothetical protein AC623_10745 [Bacillus sp. FJAT-27231]
MNKKGIWIGALLAVGIYSLSSFVEQSFDNKAMKAYDALEHDFENRVPVDEMDKDALEWIHDTTLAMEKDPYSYSDREKSIVNNLGVMVDRIGTINSLDNRDRSLEEEYYNARHSVIRALFVGEGIYLAPLK